VKRIYKNLESSVDAIVLMNAVDPHLDMSFFHATDLVTGGLFERSAAILWPDGRVEVFTSRLEEPSARKATEIDLVVYETNDERNEHLARRLSGLSNVGVNPNELTHADHQTLSATIKGPKLVDVGKAVAHARLVKDKKELDRMQRAADIASRVADEIPSMLKAGMMEYELAAEINYRMQRLGSSGPSFSTIVGFGENSAEPHYTSGERRLAEGDYVLCDFGAYYQHYASDITRTFVFGKASAKHREVYDIVLDAQRIGLEACRAGANGGDVHKAVAARIDATPYKGRFIHGTGHSLGLAVHDGPGLHPRWNLTLEEGMVMTVEPGIYLPDFGGVRIEDDVVITRDGCRLLTTAKKAFVEVHP